MSIQKSINTLTINDCVEKMRSAGIPISAEILSQGIEQGVFPFAVCVKSINRRFFIFEKLLDDWLEQRSEVFTHESV